MEASSQYLILVFFAYGLAFFTLGVVLTLVSRQESSLPIVPSLWLLAIFGILHGIHEWIEMFMLATRPTTGAVRIELLGLALLVVSFLFLGAFGADSLQRSGVRRTILWVPVILLGFWMASVVIVGGVGATGVQRVGPRWLDEADVLARYLLAIPGALLAAAALMAQQRDFRARGMPSFGRDLVWAATALLVYGVVGQLFVRQTEVFPSTVINYDLFLRWFGIPVQLLRAAAAVVLLVFMMRALRAFEVESRRRLDEAARSEVEARERLLAAERAAGQEREDLNRLLAARARELGLLLDLSNLLNEPQELRASLRAALARVVDDLAFCDASLVVLADGASDDLRVAASTGFRTNDIHSSRSRFGPSVALGNQAFAMARAACRHADGTVIVFDANSVLRGTECWGYGSPSTLVALPLLRHDHQARQIEPAGGQTLLPAGAQPAIGALVFARNKTDTTLLSVDDLHLMAGIAQQVERSLETARLYQEAQAREQTLAHLLRQVVGAQEAERRRIARELHDATGQSLSAIAMGLRGLANTAQPIPEPAEAGLDGAEASATPARIAVEPERLLRQAESLQAFATDALGELRRIIADLRPPQLDDLGLAAALRWYAQSLGERHPDLHLSFSASPDPARLPAHYETVIFRVAQEALTNVVRHAGATQAWMWLEVKPNEVVVTVQDNGRGFDPSLALAGRGDAPSWGLLGMRERALLLGGRYEFKSAPGQGTLIRLSVPRPAEPPPAKPDLDDDGA